MYSRLCRTCLQLTDNTNCVRVFDGDTKCILEECLSVQLSIDDGLPPVICLECSITIQNILKFKRRSEECEGILKEYLFSGKNNDELLLKLVQTARQAEDIQVEDVDKLAQVQRKLDTVYVVPNYGENYEIITETIVNSDNFGLNDSFNVEENDIDKDKDPAKVQSKETSDENIQPNQIVTKIELSDDEAPILSFRQVKCELSENDEKHEIPRKKRKHDKAERPSGGFECLTCGKICDSLSHLKKHQASHQSQWFDLTCPDCGKQFSKRKNLAAHRLRHKSEKFDCPSKGCGASYGDLSELVKHLAVKHQRLKKNYECNMCEARFHTRYQLTNHMKDNEKTHLSNACHNCPVKFCTERFAHVHRLLAHIKARHSLESLNPVDCSICGEKFYLIEQLNRHFGECKRRHDDPAHAQAHLCPVDENECGAKFDELYKLVKHMINVHGAEKTIRCRTCGDSFCLKDELKRHVEEYHNELIAAPVKNEDSDSDADHCDDSDQIETKKAPKKINRQCPVCNDQVNNVRSHIKLHEIAHNTYYCFTCGKKFPSISERRKHTKTEHTEKNICHYCGKLYNDSKHLMMHENPEKFYARRAITTEIKAENVECACHECGKQFKQQSVLRTHIKNIHGDNPFMACPTCNKQVKKTYYKKHVDFMHKKIRKATCSICLSRFRDRQSLEYHMRTHTDERPFSCDFCGRTFRARKTLANHIPIHTGVKRHSCAYCNKRFIQRTAMLSHQRTHTGEKPHECAVCGKRFIQSTALRQHTQRNHITLDRLQMNDSKPQLAMENVPIHLDGVSIQVQNVPIQVHNVLDHELVDVKNM